MLKSGKLAFMMLMLMLIAGCSGPTRDWQMLRDIHAEALALEGPRLQSWTSLPKTRWPPGIASLRPESVSISADGVDILMSPYFDGGWGYFIPFDDSSSPEPRGRYEPAGEGIYWYHPY